MRCGRADRSAVNNVVRRVMPFEAVTSTSSRTRGPERHAWPAPVRHTAGEQFVERHPRHPHVGRPVDAFRPPVRAACTPACHDHDRVRQITVLQFGQSEVAHFPGAIGGEQHVRRFQVPMHDAPGVGGGHPLATPASGRPRPGRSSLHTEPRPGSRRDSTKKLQFGHGGEAVETARVLNRDHQA